MLILFDIDGTLLVSRGAGMRCMEAAGEEVFGRRFGADGVDFGGGLDPVIFHALCARHGCVDGAERLAAFRAAYSRRLAAELLPGVATALPGAGELVEALSAREDVAVGLLTGNWPDTGALKLQAAGLPLDRFVVNAWGDDAKRRPDLLPVALRRYAARHGRALPAERVVVVGDTPRDVEVAREHGSRALAVATGHHDTDRLAAAGADLVVSDLSGTHRLLDWLVG